MKTLSFAILISTSLATQAQVISWNLDNTGTVNGPSVSYNGFAGVNLVSNWNNSWPNNPTANLIDSTGAATTLSLTYGSFNSYSVQGSHPGQDANGSYNKELLNGYLNSGPAAWGPSITNSYFTVSQIPYSVYNIIVYFNADTAGRNGNVTDGTTTYYFSTMGSASISGANALFTQTTDTTGLFPNADYAIFSGLSGNSQTITANALSGNDQWLGIAGFQVVAVPEPGTLALAAFGGLTMLMFKRRNQKN